MTEFKELHGNLQDTKKYLLILSYAVLAVLLMYGISTLLRINHGVPLALLEIIAEMTAAIMLGYKYRKSKQTIYLLMSWLFLLFFLGDGFYGFFYYFLEIGKPTVLSFIFTEGFYCQAYLLLASIFAYAIRNSIKHIAKSPFWPIPLLMITPMVLHFAIPLTNNTDAGSVIQYLETLSIILTYLAVVLGIIAFVFTTQLSWTLFSTGLTASLISSWAIRIDRMVGQEVRFVNYEAFWALGMCIAVLGVTTMTVSGAIEIRRNKSLVIAAKMIGLVISFASFFLLALSHWNDLQTVRSISYSSIVSLFLAGLLSHYLWDTLVQFSNAMEKLLSFELRDETPDVIRFRTYALPIEMQDLYDRTLHVRIKEFKARIETEKQLVATSEFASTISQVAHDIRSPVAALNMTLASARSLSNDERSLFRSSILRIQEIANDLLARKHNQFSIKVATQNELLELSPPLVCIIQEVIEEKKVQYGSAAESANLKFDFHQSSALVTTKMEAVDLKRVLSNLLNNAIEASDNRKEVRVHLSTDDKMAVISIRDSGKGMPPEILNRLGDHEISYGKIGGSGLGVFHAFRTIEKSGGKILYQSKINDGTTVNIQTPLVSTSSKKKLRAS